MEKNLKPIGKILTESWHLYKKHMNAFALISVIPFLFIGVKMALGPYIYNFWGQPISLAAVALSGMFSLLYVIFIITLPFALSIAIHQAKHGESPNVNAVYKKAFTSFFPYLLVLFLSAIVILGGSILFIIPGIIASIYLNLSLYVYIFEGKTGIDALVTSAWYIRNFWWDMLARKIVLAILLCIVMGVFSIIAIPLLSFLGFGAGIFLFLFRLFMFMFIIPFVFTVYYLIYKDIKSAQEARGHADTPEKAFVIEAEKIFVVLIIVAAVTVVGIFLVLNAQSVFSQSILGNVNNGGMYRYHQSWHHY